MKKIRDPRVEPKRDDILSLRGEPLIIGLVNDNHFFVANSQNERGEISTQTHMCRFSLKEHYTVIALEGVRLTDAEDKILNKKARKK